ncbi:MAG: DMT family transporter [Actinobacteria bacterium]|uniref:DMT family transporter n=1 Tax=Nostocoides veronense TaxID=330836 RepID=A0ABP4XYC7_9MICO|nr:DMT family transporter [Actinomycetota bacterium]
MSGDVDRANEPRTLAAAVVTMLFWASAFIGIRAAGQHFDPGALALLRMTVGSVVLGVIAAVRGIRWPPRRSLPGIAAWAVAWFCVYNFALNTAEQAIDAGTAALVVNLAPLMVVIVGGLVLGEGFPRALVIGAPISFLGVAIIATQSRGGLVALSGLALALLAAVMYAGCTLGQKRLLASVDSTTLTWLGAVAGTIALLPWAGRLVSDLQTAPATATMWVIYLGIFPTALAFTTWAYVLARTSAGRTAATSYIVPALAIAMSWQLLSEAPTLLTVLGGVLCLVGVAITRLGGPVRGRASGREVDG